VFFVKAIGILGSPRRIGNSAKMLDATLKVLSDNGFETEVVYLAEKKIGYCLGCGTCLMKGECFQRDDMDEIRKKIEESNVVILASPMYYLNVTAQMKTFIDRMLAYGHRPTLTGKYGGSIVVYAGVGDPKAVADYLNMVLRAWGIIPVGYAIGFGVLPGEVKEEHLKEAENLGRRILRAIEEGYKPEVDERGRKLQEQLLKLISDYRHILKADYEFWKKKGVLK